MPITEDVRRELYRTRIEGSRYDEAVDEVVRELENHVRYQGYVPVGEIERRISLRAKEFERIVEKVDRGRRRTRWVGSLSELEGIVTDIAGVRIVLDRLDQVKETGKFVKNNNRWQVIQMHQRRRGYTGYRSLHIDVLLSTTHHCDVRCEIQCRTLLEHAFALWTTPMYEYYRTDPESVPAHLFGQMCEISRSLHGVDKRVNDLVRQFERIVQ